MRVFLRCRVSNGVFPIITDVSLLELLDLEILERFRKSRAKRFDISAKQIGMFFVDGCQGHEQIFRSSRRRGWRTVGRQLFFRLEKAGETLPPARRRPERTFHHGEIAKPIHKSFDSARRHFCLAGQEWEPSFQGVDKLRRIFDHRTGPPRKPQDTRGENRGRDEEDGPKRSGPRLARNKSGGADFALRGRRRRTDRRGGGGRGRWFSCGCNRGEGRSGGRRWRRRGLR